MTMPRPHATALMSKQGQIVAALAHQLLTLAPGERLRPVQEYAVVFRAGVGTIQAALDYLQAEGALRLEARGRLGTFAAELQYPLLWSCAGLRPVVGAMPLPYSRRFEGLATGIRDLFGPEPLDLDLRFIRGAGHRMQSLASHRCDWALVSRWAAETAHAHGFVVQPVLSLGPGTYMAGHSLLLAGGATALEPGMRVGVDIQSLDHVFLVRAATRGRQIELVPIDYSRGLELALADVIDGTVWSEDDIPVDQAGVTAIPLDRSTEPALEALGEAVIVVNADNSRMQNVLGAVLDRATLLQVQQAVFDRKRLPSY